MHGLQKDLGSGPDVSQPYEGLCMAFCLIRSGGDLGIFLHSSSDSGVGQGAGGVVIAPTFWTRLVESPLP